MNKIREGKLKIDIDDTNIKRLNVEMEHSSGNISVGMIIASLIIASSVIYRAQLQSGPWIAGYPVIPSVIMIIALVLGIWLINRTIFAKLWR